MFLKRIQINNFKAFGGETEINLHVPNGKVGSGLNILVGKNGSGKTSLLEALDLISENDIVSQKYIRYSDFYDISDSIEIFVEFNELVECNFPDPWKRQYKSSGIFFTAKHRRRKSSKSPLSYPITSFRRFEPEKRIYSWYKNGSEKLSDFHLRFDLEAVNNDSFSFLYASHDRSRHSEKGYNTLFSKLTDDLNWRFLKDLDDQKEEILLEKWEDFSSAVTNDDLGKSVREIFTTVFKKNIDSLNIQLLDLVEPYSKSFFGKKSDGIKVVKLSKLGSGVELLFSLLFLKVITDQSSGSIIYCIDEPELSLHPQWQRRLFEFLVSETAEKQIILATHSPYFISSNYLSKIIKLESTDKSVKTYSLSDDLARSDKVKKIFYLENRELFFADKVILVEGPDDKSRINSFLEREDTDIYVMWGLQNFERIEQICKELNIELIRLVDLDFISKYENLKPDLSEEEIVELEELKALEQIKVSQNNPKLTKEVDKLMASMKKKSQKMMSSKIKLKMKVDETYKTTVLDKISELKDDNIFVLKNGMIEDYLDEYGNPVSQENSAELKNLFN